MLRNSPPYKNTSVWKCTLCIYHDCANFSKFDLEFDVDPLFKKTSTQFDSGGGASSQFLYNLNIRDSTRSELLLDSNAVPGAEHINLLAPTQVCSLTQFFRLHFLTMLREGLQRNCRDWHRPGKLSFDKKN